MPRMQTIFHALPVGWRVHSDVENLPPDLDGPNSELTLSWRHLLHVLRAVDATQRSSVVEELSVEMLNLQTLPVER